MSDAGARDVLVYVGTYTTDPKEGIHRFRLDPATGALTPAGQTLGIPDPFYLAIAPSRRHLYAAHAVDELDGRPEGAISAFAIDRATGDLTFVNRQPSRGTLPCYLAIDRTGQTLLTGNYNSGSVAALPIGADGRLGPATAVFQHAGSGPNAARQDGPHVHCIVLDPAERYAFAADLGTDEVRAYRVDARAGTLASASITAVHAGAGPRHIAFHPNGRFAYLLNELDGTCTAFAYTAATGGLTAVQTISTLPKGFAGTNYAADVKILPSGRFLYGTNRGHDSIAIFAIDATTGQLTAAGHAPAGGRWPWNIALDPTASFLLAADYESDLVAVFRVDGDTGALTPTGHAAAAPKPVNLAILA